MRSKLLQDAPGYGERAPLVASGGMYGLRSVSTVSSLSGVFYIVRLGNTSGYCNSVTQGVHYSPRGEDLKTELNQWDTTGREQYCPVENIAQVQPCHTGLLYTPGQH
jgi:hypothetical protein